MLNLTEQIIKFQKMTFQNRLDDIITIQEGFETGRLTIHDLVRQNHNIITQFRKMKNVFINYTKINKKMQIIQYSSNQKINQYQLNLGTQIINLGRLSNYIEKLAQGTLNNMKNIYNSTLEQTKTCIDQTDNMLKVVEQKIKEKIDRKQFQQNIDKLKQDLLKDEQSFYDDYNRMNSNNPKVFQKFMASQSYRQVDISIEPRIINEKIGEAKVISNNEIYSPGFKRKKAQQIEQMIFKTKVQLYDEITQKIQKQLKQELNEIIEENNKNLKNSIQQNLVKVFTGRFEQYNREFKKEKRQIKQNLQKISKQLELRTCQQTRIKNRQWISGFIKQKYLNQMNDKIDENKMLLNHNDKKQISIMSDFKIQLKQRIDQQLNIMERKLGKFQQKYQKQIKIQRKKIDQNKLQYKTQFKKTNTQLKQLEKQYTNHKNTTNNQLQQLKSTLNKLCQTLKQTLTQLLYIKFQQNFKNIQIQFTNFRKHQNQTDKKLVQVFQIIKHIKQAVARKVNFAQFISLFQKKANKTQLGQVKQLINLKTQSNTNTVRKDSRFTTQYEFFKQKSKTSQTKYLKTSLDFHNSHIKISQNSFVLGLSNKGQKQKMLKQKIYRTKRSKFRPVTAQTTILIK